MMSSIHRGPRILVRRRATRWCVRRGLAARRVPRRCLEIDLSDLTFAERDGQEVTRVGPKNGREISRRRCVWAEIVQDNASAISHHDPGDLVRGRDALGPALSK